MDNFQNSQVKKDLQLNESLEASKLKTQKMDNNSLLTNNKNNNSYQPKNLPVLEDIIKNNEELTLTQNEKTKRKNKEKVDEESKEDSSMKSRKDSNSKRNKKTIKKRKPKKEQQIGGTIKVVGKISNKLQSLIERLGQNAAKENESNTKKENKYVTGSNVKDALERIRKMKEEEEKKKIFVKSKFIWVDVPDSNEVKKEEPKLNNIRDFKKDDKNDTEEDEEEEEEEDDESEENHKIKKSIRKTMPELTFERFINSKDENNKEKKKRKKRKKKDKALNPLKENSSEDREKKKKKKTQKRK